MICQLCPRECGAERTETKRGGVCRQPSLPVAARAMLHLWEEPCLVGDHGAGTVFFSGCNLRCCFCQNKPISQGEVGKVLTVERLREIFHQLIEQGAACLDLVTPTTLQTPFWRLWETSRGPCRWCGTAAATRSRRPSGGWKEESRCICRT